MEFRLSDADLERLVVPSNWPNGITDHDPNEYLKLNQLSSSINGHATHIQPLISRLSSNNYQPFISHLSSTFDSSSIQSRKIFKTYSASITRRTRQVPETVIPVTVSTPSTRTTTHTIDDRLLRSTETPYSSQTIETSPPMNTTIDSILLCAYDMCNETSSEYGITISNTTGNITNTTDWESEPDLRIHHPILALFLILVCLIVMFGNILIMVAIRRERYLHTVTNLFVASLAVADCLVGVIVMPSSVVLEVMNKWWIFGRDWCDLWHSFDVLASTASILNLCVISLDRYLAITDPITYPSRMTPKRAKFFIALIWLLSSLLSFPAIIWWRAVSPPPEPLRCDFTGDTGYLLFSSIISFYGPLFVMSFVYFRIYRAAIEQKRSVKLGSKITDSDGIVLRIHRGGGAAAASAAELKAKLSGEISFTDDSSGPGDRVTFTLPENGITDGTSVRNRNMKAFSISRKLTKLAKERKAAKTLGIVMGVFILCWMPFFITNVLKGIGGDQYLVNPDVVYPVVTWLGWLNSAMNPVIYACWSRDFRRAFNKILCSCYKKTARKRRSRAMQHSKYSYCADIAGRLRDVHGFKSNQTLADIQLSGISDGGVGVMKIREADKRAEIFFVHQK